MTRRTWAMRIMRFGAIALVVLVLAGCSKAAAPPGGATPSTDANVPASGPAREIAAGTEHTCARLADGRIACWGSNAHGQLGSNTAQKCSIEDLLHGGGAYVYACSPKPLVVAGLDSASRVVAGGDTSCAKTTSGAVFCWGRNDNGLVGDGSTSDRSAPTRVLLPAPAADIAMSDTHACARLVDGTVACWGVGFDGQLGFPIAPTGDTSARGELAVVASTPARVSNLTAATEVVVGSRATCIRIASGEVSCFGLVGLGDSGTFYRVPRTPMPELAAAKRIFLGDATHCATFTEGSSCWGSSSEGPLAKANADGLRWSKLVRSTAVVAPRALAIVYGRACAADAIGDVTCWGYDGRGKSDPRKIEGVARVTGLGVGASHACALTESGTVACWGSSASGQIDRVDAVHTSPLFGEPRPIALP